MKKLLFYTNLILFLVLIGCATEQKTLQQANIPQEKCDEPIWNEGDTWRWGGPNYYFMEVRIIKIDEEFYVIEENSQAGKYTTKFDKKTQRFAGFKYSKGANLATWGTRLRYGEQTDIRFPIYVGTKWSFWFLGLVESKVVAYEDVTVPAGTFEAFRIDCFNTRGDLTGSYWYSPKVKTAVKGLSDGRTVSELISYKIKDE